MPNDVNRVAKEQALRLIKSSRGSGEPLDPVAKLQLEARTGLDLSAVRVYSGPAAKKACQSLGARAFAVGDEVVINVDLSQDSAQAAHELTHVLQRRDRD